MILRDIGFCTSVDTVEDEFEQDTQSFDHDGRPLRQVGEGAFTDFSGLAIGFAQQDGGRGVSVGDGLDVHGY